MNWQEIRALLPNRWVIVEAINAHSEGRQRVINELAIWKICGADSSEAWDCCEQLHRTYPGREFYLFHTDRVELNVGLMDARGRLVDAEGKAVSPA
jgi:hypothetical protein